MGVGIRPATLEDIPALRAFLYAWDNGAYTALADKYLRLFEARGDVQPQFLIAEKEGILVASACVTEELFQPNTWGISWVRVEDSLQGNGIGAEMVEASLDKIRKSMDGDKTTVLLGTFPGKSRLYEKFGFQKAAEDHIGGTMMYLVLPKEKVVEHGR
ncbi:MAG: GNAT family N-acetyltransferase [Pseudomonadaceae bacterium]|nr:GNAT family N-acetyltransferase [Pseudomonadaceae bacterium]